MQPLHICLTQMNKKAFSFIYSCTHPLSFVSPPETPLSADNAAGVKYLCVAAIKCKEGRTVLPKPTFSMTILLCFIKETNLVAFPSETRASLLMSLFAVCEQPWLRLDQVELLCIYSVLCYILSSKEPAHYQSLHFIQQRSHTEWRSINSIQVLTSPLRKCLACAI